MRFKVIDDTKLRALIEKKEFIVAEAIILEKEKEKIEEELNKKVLKLNRLSDKAIPLTKKYQDEKELGEFEEYSRLYFSGKPEDNDRELRLEIFNHLEEYKQFFLKQKEAKKKKENAAKESNTNKDDSK